MNTSAQNDHFLRLLRVAELPDMLNLENWDFYHWKLAADAETRHHFSRGTRMCFQRMDSSIFVILKLRFSNYNLLGQPFMISIWC